jgi:dCTP deaminase
MAVVHKSEIRRRLNLDLEDVESLVITPLLQETDVLGEDSDADAVDLRLGTYFLLPQVPPQPFFFPSKSFAKSTHFRVHVPLGSYLVVPAHQTVLGSTLEFLKLPIDLSGQILTKSSIARTFMVIETAPWIHPCYRGCLTLEIANVSNTPLLLYPGRFVGQLILMELDQEKPATRKLSGSYLGPVYPEPPVFKDPEEDLAIIGVPKSDFRRPGAAWMKASDGK